jgi:hypothetical protein
MRALGSLLVAINTGMLSSLMQVFAIEPLPLVGTAFAEPDERELAVAYRRQVPSQRSSKKRGKEHLRTQAPQRRADAASSSYKSFSIAFSLHVNVAVSHTLLDGISTDIMQHSPAARTWLQFEQRP